AGYAAGRQSEKLEKPNNQTKKYREAGKDAGKLEKRKSILGTVRALTKFLKKQKPVLSTWKEKCRIWNKCRQKADSNTNGRL
ncbi:MAG: hypothetical protein K2G28_01570, partial [Acetatifactor sp.]|nr:hypothetical protein [Acetatifactor sp.]